MHNSLLTFENCVGSAKSTVFGSLNGICTHLPSGSGHTTSLNCFKFTPSSQKKFQIVFTLPICLIFFSPNDFCSSRFSHFVFASCGISGPLNENFDSALPFHFPPWRILPSNPRSPPLGQDQIIYQCTAKRLCLQCTLYTLGSNAQSSVQSDSHPYKSNAI